MLAQNRGNVYDVVAQLYAEEGLAASSVVFPILQNPNSVVTPFFASLDTDVGPAAQDHRAADRGSRADADAPAGVLRAPVGLRHARQPGGHPAAACCSDFVASAQGLPGRDGRAGPGRQRHDVHAVRVRPHVQAREQRRAPTTAGATTRSWWAARSRAATSTARVPTHALNGPDDLGKRRPLDSDDVGRAVRRDAVPLVRHRRGRPAVRLPEHRRVREHQPRIHGVTPSA